MPRRSRRGVRVYKGPISAVKRPRRLARTRRVRLAKAAARALHRGRQISAESAPDLGPENRDNSVQLNGVPGTPDCSCPHVEGTELELNFSSPRELFCSLIAPVTEDEFFSKHWEREPLLVKRRRNSKHLTRHRSLFSLAALRELVEDAPILFGRHVNVCSYKNGRKVSYGCPGERLSGALLGKLWTRKKATVQFFQPQQFQDELWRMLSLLESYFNCLVGSNVYITPCGSQGLAPHYDDVEVFILQLEGSKRWLLYPPSHSLPQTSSPDLCPEDIGTPSHDFVLEAGDMLYFPRGTIHHASTPSHISHSTHITISTYQQNTWGDLLSHALNSTLHQLMATNKEYRVGLPLHLSSQNGTKCGDAIASSGDRLQAMGGSILDHMRAHHESILAGHRVAFITARLPPCTTDHGPQGAAPSPECRVQLTWPDHMAVVTASQVRDLLEAGLLPPESSAAWAEEGEGEEGEEEEGEGEGELIVYHSLANDRMSHMVTEGDPPQPRGVRLPAHHLPALSLLSSSPLPASSLPLSPEDTHTLLLSLWVEGLLQVT